MFRRRTLSQRTLSRMSQVRNRFGLSIFARNLCELVPATAGHARLVAAGEPKAKKRKQIDDKEPPLAEEQISSLKKCPGHIVSMYAACISVSSLEACSRTLRMMKNTADYRIEASWKTKKVSVRERNAASKARWTYSHESLQIGILLANAVVSWLRSIHASSSKK